MIELVDKIYQSRTTDAFTPVTKRTYEEHRAVSDIQTAELMIHIRALASQIGATLPEGEELDSLVEQVVLEQRKEVTIEREMQTFIKREQQYADGAWSERMKRMVGKTNVNPYLKYGEDVFTKNTPYPQQQDNSEALLTIIAQVQQNQTEQTKMFNAMMEKMSNNTGNPIVEEAKENAQ